MHYAGAGSGGVFWMAAFANKIAKGGAAAEAECRRMVSEKFLAAAAARDAAAAALVGGKGIDTAARLALTPIERARLRNRIMPKTTRIAMTPRSPERLRIRGLALQ